MSNNSLNYLSVAGQGLKKSDHVNANQFENYPNEFRAVTLSGKRDPIEEPGDASGGCPVGMICVEGVCVPVVDDRIYRG
jgi:hypothetical protein